MPYLKFKADRLFTGSGFLGPDHVLITDSDGTVIAIVPAETAGADVRRLDGILCPGFVNTHCHLELSHMKGLIPEQTGLVDFVFKVVTERHFSPELIADAITKAEKEMYDAGIVAVGDICNNYSTAVQKQGSQIAYYNFVEVSGWIPAVAESRFAQSAAIRTTLEANQKTKSFPAPTTNPKPQTANQCSLSPHAPYSVSEPLWQLLEAGFPGKTITMHNQETAFEDSLFLDGSGDFNRMYAKMGLDNSFFRAAGKTSLQNSFPRLQKAKRVILVHNTFTSEADMVYIRDTADPDQVYWCLCPNANLYIEKKLPNLHGLRKHDCRITIGTDSLASNHQLNVLEELKTLQLHFPGIPMGEMLQWATLNGAMALQLEDTLGSFEPGKQPGLVLITGMENDTFTEHTYARRIG